MAELANYYEKVYAGVLGKVIGVFVGKPFEGWSNERIENELGEIWYYVHDRLSYPLVCPDDDISGTFTFLRALADHSPQPGAAVPHITSEQIGRTWLNYLIEHQTVLWWGGLGVSTEHTAWLRLAAGVAAPESGSISMNGRTVAEQIGAQIFIDGFGMVAPGDPHLAARLAGEAARVSHDGEAVYAAQAVAAMEAAAFTESRMNRLLDIGLSAMPPDCLIADVHRDVRSWAEKHGDDWRATLRKIQAKYGYDKYGGGCHMVPNHAVMVMAWAHAPNDFQKSLMIANTAGWDTDCNSGNVGCLMGIKLGLAGINVGPDWQTPFADRVVIPTAEGSRGITDVLREADLVATLGRTVMDWKQPAPPKNGARFHFSLPGSRHGFMPERAIDTQDDTYLSNTDGRLSVQFVKLAPGKPVRISTPTFLAPEQLVPRTRSSYAPAATPTLYSGQTITASLRHTAGDAVLARLFVRYYIASPDPAAEQACVLNGFACSKPVRVRPRGTAKLSFTAPDTAGLPIAAVGVQFEPAPPRGNKATCAAGVVELDWLTWSGEPTIQFSQPVRPQANLNTYVGWIVNCTTANRAAWGPSMTLSANRGVGIAHTGNDGWANYAVIAKVTIRLADRAGLAARYGGLYRYIGLLYSHQAGELQIVRQHDEEQQSLAKAAYDWPLNEPREMKLIVSGDRAVGLVGGQAILDASLVSADGRPLALPAGGIALISDTGTTSFSDVAVEPAGS